MELIERRHKWSDEPADLSDRGGVLGGGQRAAEPLPDHRVFVAPRHLRRVRAIATSIGCSNDCCRSRSGGSLRRNHIRLGPELLPTKSLGPTFGWRSRSGIAQASAS